MSDQVSLERRCFNRGLTRGVFAFGINSFMRYGTKNWYVVPLLLGCAEGISTGIGPYIIEKNNTLKKLHTTTKITILHAFLFFSICTISSTISNWHERVISYSDYAYKKLPFCSFFYLIELGR